MPFLIHGTCLTSRVGCREISFYARRSAGATLGALFMPQDNLRSGAIHGATSRVHQLGSLKVNTYKGSSWGLWPDPRSPSPLRFTHGFTHHRTPRHALTHSREQADREPEQLDFSTPSLGAPGAPRGAYRENAAVRDAKPVKSSGVGGRAAVGLLAGPARAARAPPREAYILITLLETKPAAVRGFRCGALERATLLKPYHTSTTSRPLLHSRLIHDGVRRNSPICS